ncbi:MAG: hypothetical protein IJA60_04565 [Clostridia bacterium]|nr:hypothetical protein [Clostridia bacterium]
MKKICFTFFMIGALCLFFLFSCSKSGTLYDIITSVTVNDKSLPAGRILCYGRMYDNTVSDDTLSEYLGLEGYPEFKDRIEDMAVYSSVNGDYCELAAMKLYKASDTPDGKLFFERRIAAATRALNMSGQKGYAEGAYIKVYGNTVVLYMMPDNASVEKQMRKVKQVF